MARLLTATFPILLVACTSNGDSSGDSADPRDDIDSDVVGVIRTLDHVPQSDAQLKLGGDTQDANGAGIAVTLHIPPGNIPAKGLLDGHAQSDVSVDVLSGWDSAAQFYVVPFTEYTAQVTNGAAQITEPGVFTIAAPAESLELGNAPANESLTVRVAVVSRADTLAMPGSLNALSLDAVVSPIRLFHAIRLKRPDGEAWSFEEPAILSIDIAADDPMRTAGELYWYWYNPEQGYWQRTSQVSIAGDVASGSISLFAWWGIGSPNLGDQSCAKGRVETASGDPIPRAEVLLWADDIFGTHRTHTDFQGNFCASVPREANVNARVFGIDQFSGVRFQGATSFVSEPTTTDCATTCVDIGTVQTEAVGR